MDIVNEKIKEDCLERWGKENECENTEWFSNNYSEWIKSIDSPNREIVYQLLEKFEFYGHTYVNRGLKELYTTFINKYDINNDETVYTYVKKTDSSLNSSVQYMVEYITINKISEKNCVMNIEDIDEEQLSNIKNIVIIDDYSGSGQSIIKYINKNCERFIQKSIYILLISMSEGADINIINEFRNKEIDINIEVINIEKKAFSQLKVSEKEILEKRKQFELISKKKKINEEEIWGRDNTEALISFYNNTPNNTLGIFWKKTPTNNPLFPRNENKAPAWRRMNRDKKIRQLQNANNYIGGKDG